MATATAEKEKTSTVAPWGIEADHPRNADILVQGITNCRIRSALKATKDVFTKSPETGEQELTSKTAHLIPGLPSNVPGQQLHVDPAKGTWKVYDPLTKDERVCERLQKAIEAHTSMSVASKIRGIPMSEGRLSRDQMKTLLREMLNLVDAGYVKVVNGMKPDWDDINEMPGDYLSNPLGRTDWHIPRYEKDTAEWVEGLNRMR